MRLIRIVMLLLDSAIVLPPRARSLVVRGFLGPGAVARLDIPQETVKTELPLDLSICFFSFLFFWSRCNAPRVIEG